MLRNRLISSLLLLCLVYTGCRPVDDTTFLPNQLLIFIEEPGIYQLTLADLQAHGFTQASLEASNLYLSSGETAVPYLILNNSLIFYGQASTDRYTAVRAYHLETGKPGVLMAQTAVIPTQSPAHSAQFSQIAVLEKNNLYESRARTDTVDDPWFWHRLVQGSDLTIPLPLAQVSSGAGTLTLDLWGASDHPKFNPDHTLTVTVNGRFTTTVQWNGAAHFNGNVSLPPGTLHDGTNTITLHNPPLDNSEIDIIFLDTITARVDALPTAINETITGSVEAGFLQLHNLPSDALIFDISLPDKPQLLTEWQMVNKTIAMELKTGRTITAVAAPTRLLDRQLARVPHSTLKQPATGADLIIISADTLIPALPPLVAHRTTDGLRVAIVPMSELATAFGGGVATPAAIDDFITFAVLEWPPPQPRYVLLVGDATSDYREYQYPHPAAYLPSPMVHVQFSGETVSDAPYADVDGDGLPDLAVGRWPVNDKTAVSRLVQRTITYESGTAPPNAQVVVDPTEPGFARMAERLGVNDSQTAVWQASDSWLGAYIGHGSLTRWGQPALLTTDTIEQPLPPILLQFTCLTGLFAHPTEPSLTEVMITSRHGPVLTVAATSLTLSNHQEPFARSLWQQLGNTAVVRIGDAFLQAKHDLPFTENGAYQEISDTFTLFGDPATRIMRP